MSDQESSIPLSERELQVLQMVAKGASNQQIAHQLVISINTVKVHLRNIFEKLEVQSRTEASLRAIQEGWVNLSDSGKSENPQLPAKTFLLADQIVSPLPHWQQIYLTVALFLMLAAVTTPLIVREPITEKPYLRLVITADDQLYQQAATPTPLTTADNLPSRWRAHSEMTVSRAGLGLAVFDNKIYA
ncbi:MAG: response regulator transcription factor, partial [Anaerolineae bacterium]|nr:response regulator transcription factor [Anaerolineae bacterium]